MDFVSHISVPPFFSFNCAVVLLIFGKVMSLNFSVLQRYSIPDPVTGGFLCILVTSIWWAFTGDEISFSLDLRDYLLLLFFSGIGLKSDIKTLTIGGRPLLILTVLAAIFILLQNIIGMLGAYLFSLPIQSGLMVGSVSLTGGVGTALAWAPIFVQNYQVTNALELGISSNTFGLITACVIGGPIATFLIKRNHIESSNEEHLDVGVSNDGRAATLDYICVLWAILALNITVIFGTFIHEMIVLTGLVLPKFVGCLLSGIILRNLLPYSPSKAVRRVWPGLDDALTLISDLSLGLFLVMALMGLQIWQLSGALMFITTTLVAQVILTVVFILFVVFPLMGRDYEAAVISSGFGGIALGSTATAIANMTAVSQQYGAAHRAFIIVPLVCGFFIDIINALIISLLL